nr:serine/threonine-protein kinase SRK2A [Ipomoea batatas]
MEKYELVKDIGSGNFGVARLMRNKETKELVAMKYIERGLKDHDDPKNFRKTIQRIMSVQYKIPDYVHISQDCRHLLSRIFVANPARRITIKDIKSHPWFLKNLPRELTEVAQAAYYRRENPTFSLQSVEEIMKIVDEAKTPPPASRSIGGFGWEDEEDEKKEGDVEEEEQQQEDEDEEEGEDGEDEYEKQLKRAHESGEVRVT